VSKTKLGEPFGLDSKLVSSIDWAVALGRILEDIKSDFIFAPHVNFIYRKAGNELIAEVKNELNKGGFSPELPITVEVPKSFRVRVVAPPDRLGPSFSRPGSILLPKDRLLYQALADQSTTVIFGKSDHKRSFSHQLAPDDSASMFLSTRICWNDLQSALKRHSALPKINYIMKLDVANCFGSINQHTLINTLRDAGYDERLLSRLENLLLSFTPDRSSRGIIQGIFPSDLFGNFYLTPIDQLCEDEGIPTARYVDDIYAFLRSIDESEDFLRKLIPGLRSYDLVLNEAKCVLMPKQALITEEPDLESLFNAAMEEVSSQLEDAEFNAGYGFQSEWDDESADTEEEEKEEGEDIELQATMLLFDSIDQYPGHEESIERFCLPIFSAVDSHYALDHTIASFRTRPSMTQIYCVYLAKFMTQRRVEDFLVEAAADHDLLDWQRTWPLAALLQKPPTTRETIRVALSILNDANRHETLRAIAAVFIGRHGDITRRRSLIDLYPRTSDYIQAAIYFSSRSWPSVERSNAKATWGAQGSLNRLLTVAMGKP